MVKEMTEDVMMEEENKTIKIEDIILCKCFSCGKCYTTDMMIPIKINESFEEAMQIVKRYICKSCMQEIKDGKPIVEYGNRKKKDDFEVDF